jgi:hypothetical protein
MRYSRFRATMLGIEPQKRNRTTTSKNRVSKSKKDVKVKKTRDDDSVKEDPDEFQESASQGQTEMDLPRTKREMSQLSPERATMTTMFGTTSVPMSAANMQSQLQARLLTPCSDSDVLATSSCYGASPGSEMLHRDASYDFTGSSPCGHGHDQISWSHGHSYPSFGVNFDLNGYSPGSSGHQNSHLADGRLGLHQHHQHHQHHHSQLSGQEYGLPQHSQLAREELRLAHSMMESDEDNVMVKHEDWDHQTAL